MSKTLLGSWCPFNVSATSSPARWWSISAGGTSGGGDTVEAQEKWKINIGGTVADMRCRVKQNGLSGSATFGTRINGASGNVQCSIASGVTGQFSDSTHSDVVSTGNSLYSQFSGLTFLGQMTITAYSMSFAASSAVANIWQYQSGMTSGSYSTFNGGTASVSRYSPLAGGNTTGGDFSATTESVSQQPIRAAGSFSRPSIYIATNTSTNAMTLAMRVNAATGNGSISIGASSTGLIEDTTHSDSVVSGDNVCVMGTTGAGTVNATYLMYGSTFTSSSTNWDDRICYSKNAGVGMGTSAGTTYYVVPRGCFGDASLAENIMTTEADAQLKLPFAFYYNRLILNIVYTSSQTNAWTFKSRQNGADGLLALSPTINVTGIYEDTTHVDAIAVDDLYCIAMVVPGSGGGTVQVGAAGVTGDTVSPAIVTRQYDFFTVL